MSDYSSYIERDQFNEKICELVDEYIDNALLYPVDSVLAIQSVTYELKLCSATEINESWDTYDISSLIRDNEEGKGRETDIDATNDIANSYFFVR
jgi:hypothetical protein